MYISYQLRDLKNYVSETLFWHLLTLTKKFLNLAIQYSLVPTVLIVTFFHCCFYKY